MEQEFDQFKLNVDSWIKHFNSKLSDFTTLRKEFEENVDNTDHNYELIHELSHNLSQLRKELESVKIMQIVLLRNELAKGPTKKIENL